MKLPPLTLFTISILVSHFLQLPAFLFFSQTTISCLNVLSFIFYFQFYLLDLEQFLLLCFNEMLLVSLPNSLDKINQKFQGTGFWVHSEYAFTTPGMLTAATTKSLQSYLTLWDPIDGSPPGSPVPGILQARTLEWVAISFSNA